ncbi:hypothetical protein BJ508DRAFT_314306 [Ascobolus immersus RN42]|uniref:Uncharacterized protein n=1 Tax=Ascobolus immersus RN42 TaxID=1160509 RepID=A0A3N4HM59_ASCIM|nr:hypothetical protein BJ508DRAFT_314306 [Ascobolus immersus RN42]
MASSIVESTYSRKGIAGTGIEETTGPLHHTIASSRDDIEFPSSSSMQDRSSSSSEVETTRLPEKPKMAGSLADKRHRITGLKSHMVEYAPSPGTANSNSTTLSFIWCPENFGGLSESKHPVVGQSVAFYKVNNGVGLPFDAGLQFLSEEEKTLHTGVAMVDKKRRSFMGWIRLFDIHILEGREKDFPHIKAYIRESHPFFWEKGGGVCASGLVEFFDYTIASVPVPLVPSSFGDDVFSMRGALPAYIESPTSGTTILSRPERFRKVIKEEDVTFSGDLLYGGDSQGSNPADIAYDQSDAAKKPGIVQPHMHGQTQAHGYSYAHAGKNCQHVHRWPGDESESSEPSHDPYQGTCESDGGRNESIKSTSGSSNTFKSTSRPQDVVKLKFKEEQFDSQVRSRPSAALNGSCTYTARPTIEYSHLPSNSPPVRHMSPYALPPASQSAHGYQGPRAQTYTEMQLGNVIKRLRTENANLKRKVRGLEDQLNLSQHSVVKVETYASELEAEMRHERDEKILRMFFPESSLPRGPAISRGRVSSNTLSNISRMPIKSSPPPRTPYGSDKMRAHGQGIRKFLQR